MSSRHLTQLLSNDTVDPHIASHSMSFFLRDCTPFPSLFVESRITYNRDRMDYIEIAPSPTSPLHLKTKEAWFTDNGVCITAEYAIFLPSIKCSFFTLCVIFAHSRKIHVANNFTRQNANNTCTRKIHALQYSINTNGSSNYRRKSKSTIIIIHIMQDTPRRENSSTRHKEKPNRLYELYEQSFYLVARYNYWMFSFFMRHILSSIKYFQIKILRNSLSHSVG